MIYYYYSAEILSLFSNALTGSIPTEILQLTNLGKYTVPVWVVLLLGIEYMYKSLTCVFP